MWLMGLNRPPKVSIKYQNYNDIAIRTYQPVRCRCAAPILDCILWLPHRVNVPDGERIVHIDEEKKHMLMKLHRNNETPPLSLGNATDKVNAVSLVNGPMKILEAPHSEMESLVISDTCNREWVSHITGYKMLSRTVGGGGWGMSDYLSLILFGRKMLPWNANFCMATMTEAAIRYTFNSEMSSIPVLTDQQMIYQSYRDAIELSLLKWL